MKKISAEEAERLKIKSSRKPSFRELRLSSSFKTQSLRAFLKIF